MNTSDLKYSDAPIELNTSSASDLHKQIADCMSAHLKSGVEVDLYFDGNRLQFNATPRSLTEPLPRPLASAIHKMAPAYLAGEIEDFDLTKNISGRLFLDAKGGVFLDAEDIDGDWDYQRDVDLDNLEDYSFEDVDSCPEP